MHEEQADLLLLSGVQSISAPQGPFIVPSAGDSTL